MKRFILSFLIFFFIQSVSFSQKAFFEQRFNLHDGDSVKFSFVCRDTCDEIMAQQINAITMKYYLEGMSNPVLRSLFHPDDNANIQSQLKETVDYNTLYLNSLYNSLFEVLRIKIVREIVAKLIVATIRDLCDFFPKDFRDDFLTKSKLIKKTLVNMPNHKYEINEYDVIMIDDKRSVNPYTLEASVLRRILIDSIPREEIIGYIDDAIAAAQKAEPANDVLYRANINGRISYIVDLKGERIVFSNGVPLKDETGGMVGLTYPTIYNFNDDYYLIKNSTQWIESNAKYGSLNYLIDGDGNVVYRKLVEE